MSYQVSYDFYKKYNNLDDFVSKYEERKKTIKDRYKLKLNDELLVKEYFVEIFSWTVLPKEVLKFIKDIIDKNNIKLIIDPSCGNAFHGYLFENLFNIKSVNIDLQNEKKSWLPVTVGDGRDYLSYQLKYVHEKSILLLSWIDYEKLCLEFMDLFKGNIIISLGNYDELCPNYKKKLNHNFELIEKIEFEMPWGLSETMEKYLYIYE